MSQAAQQFGNPQRDGDSASTVNLTAEHEAFCIAFVELDNASAAYRRVYDPQGRQPSQQIWSNAARLMSHPGVSARVRQLRDIAAAAAIVRAVDLMRDWYDIATADPNEIVSVRVESCRCCHGVGHAYQWVDDAEYAQAYDAAMNVPPKRGQASPQAPDMSGGFGYDPKQEPALDCPRCFGNGVQHVRLQDTTKLSPAARKLYKGAKEDRFGAVEVFMHDQEQAREKLARMLGAFKDGVGVPGVPLPHQHEIKADATDEDATRRYLQMMQR